MNKHVKAEQVGGRSAKGLLPKQSVQLCSVKTELSEDFVGTLTILAAMGFEGVEFAGEFGPYVDSPIGLKAMLDSLGLEVSGAHIQLSQFDDAHFEQSVAFYQAIGAEVLILPWDERAWDKTKFNEFIDELNTLEKTLAAYGFKTGFHNHQHEFNQYQGSTFWDHIAQMTQDSFILQLDVGWVTYAGKDPIKYIKKYPGRTVTTHYKAKLPKEGENPLGLKPLIGEDITDWLALLKANIAVGGTQWLVIEQDERPDGLTSLEALRASKIGLDKVMQALSLSLI